MMELVEGAHNSSAEERMPLSSDECARCSDDGLAGLPRAGVQAGRAAWTLPPSAAEVVGRESPACVGGGGRARANTSTAMLDLVKLRSSDEVAMRRLNKQFGLSSSPRSRAAAGGGSGSALGSPRGRSRAATVMGKT